MALFLNELIVNPVFDKAMLSFVGLQHDVTGRGQAKRQLLEQQVREQMKTIYLQIEILNRLARAAEIPR